VNVWVISSELDTASRCPPRSYPASSTFASRPFTRTGSAYRPSGAAQSRVAESSPVAARSVCRTSTNRVPVSGLARASVVSAGSLDGGPVTGSVLVSGAAARRK
jgi:hypothetical protein